MPSNRYALLAAGDNFTVLISRFADVARCTRAETCVASLDMALYSLATRFPRSTLTTDQAQHMLASLGLAQEQALRLLPPAIPGAGIVAGFRAAAYLVCTWAAPLECRATSVLVAEAMATVHAFHGQFGTLRPFASGAIASRRPGRPPTLRMHPAKDCKVIPFPKPYQEPAR